MEYKRIENTIYARLDVGEEILEQVQAIAQAEGIRLANLNGLGAVNDLTVGVWRPVLQRYDSNRFEGDYEIVSLTGTITTMDGACYCHLHLAAGDSGGHVVGGHLNRAVVSATAELVLHISEGTVERRFEPAVGLNLMYFDV